MSRHHRRRCALAGFLAFAALIVAVPAGAESDKPDYTQNDHRTVTPHVENTVCGDFSPTELVFTGPSHSRYQTWLLPDQPGAEEEGWIDIKVSASAAGHEYLIHQRYRFEPRQFREFIYGWAVTVIKRDDGATMQGDSVLWLDTVDFREEINWLETPTCTPPRH